MATPPSDAELEFYYTGLHKVLKRYSFMAVLGWLVTLAGGAALPLGWSTGMPHGALDLVLAVGTMLAGVGVVQLSVSSLQSYVTVPFPTAQPGGTDPPSPVVGEIRQIMKDVEEGGWMEARSALRALESLGAAHGLPPLRQAKHTTEG